MRSEPTIESLLASARGDAVALLAPDALPLTYDGLRGLVGKTIAALNKYGIGRDDRVAIVLPNGAEMATTFIAVASGATSAPLNPAYRLDEFEFYMSDLRAEAVIVEQGSVSPAIEAAHRLGIAVLHSTPDPEQGAGGFTLSGGHEGLASRPGPAGRDDIALILHTSGTTSRPKIVPLSQRNVVTSAANIAGTLEFTESDRGLKIMPLFHIHGLVAGLLAPLSRGSSVYCTPGFNALKFFAWLDEVKPTWYTAVPTMHQAILARAPRNAEIVARNRLRFIRSSSSSLPPQVLRELEAMFGVPVIESYGMTEAAHQMASNPLPPAPRRPGSVGLAAGPEIAIMDAAGALLAPGAVGEVVIRGPNVTRGYENNPQANEGAFSHGWFRTGDQGVIDDAGYLTLTGRLKELINRGGEKISPREVDEILLDHPAVEQAVTFALPHDKLGEDVAAAVVLRDGKTVDERGLRDFCATRLADFKVPRKIVFLAEIPKGATGKLTRIGLAEKLGLTP